MTHYIAMGGDRGFMPDNCQAYDTRESAIDGLDNLYELSREQLKVLTHYGDTNLKREQGGSYCEVSECDCPRPWEHGEGDEPENWPEYHEEEE
jgi:hypothetical protein